MFGRMTKRQIGNLGEGIACNFLIKKNFLILARNYWKKWGEIDIVAEKGEITYFIEVKTVSCETSKVSGPDVTRENISSGLDRHRAEDNVHPWKLKRLARTIQSYLLEKNFPDYKKWRFDVVTVELNLADKRAKIKHLEDIILS